MWEESLSINVFKGRNSDRLSCYRIIWIIICVFVFVITLLVAIIAIIVPDMNILDTLVAVEFVLQLIFSAACIIYFIVNFIRFQCYLRQNDSSMNINEARIKNIFIFLANVGLFIYMIGLLLVIVGSFAFSDFGGEMFTYGLIYIGQVICDFFVLLAILRFKEEKKYSTGSTKNKSRSTKS